MLRILFVDDKASSIAEAKDLLESSDGHHCRVCNFNEAETNIKEISPDVIILDLLEGESASESEQSGWKTLEFIWAKRFCPIIFYTAVPEYLESDTRVLTHPFIKNVKKGSGSQHEVKKSLDGFAGHIKAIQKAEDNLDQVFCTAIREIAENAFRDYADDTVRDEILIRCGRRRISAFVDGSLVGDKIASWEQYIYPPLSADTELGDIIKKTSEDSTQAASFRIVLTPSCDLVSTNGRHPAVKHVLVAKCCPISALRSGTALCKIREKGEFRNSLISNALRQGFYQKMIVIPQLPSKFPDMVANLKELELLPISDISTVNSSPFTRVASVDSPFRELVSWAYLQTGCRPGLPERDFDRWADEILPQLGMA